MQMFFNGRNDAIKFMESYSSMILKVKKQSAERTVLKKNINSSTNASKITYSTCTNKTR